MPGPGCGRWYHLRPALPVAVAGGAGGVAAGLHRTARCRLRLRARRLPGGIRGGRRIDPQDSRIGRQGRRVLTVTRSRHDRSLSFGSAAAAYERGRPSYPPEAINWLLPRGARQVLDLGAGTGKLTTRLVERGLEVVAVDPIPDMLEVLGKSLPDTPALLGTAEEIPLPDDSVDAVLVAQAWHWVDPERAIPEVARVLRPGGRLGLVWNTRDARLGWVRELGEIIGSDGDRGSFDVTLSTSFTAAERHQVEWTNYLTPQ